MAATGFQQEVGINVMREECVCVFCYEHSTHTQHLAPLLPIHTHTHTHKELNLLSPYIEVAFGEAT